MDDDVESARADGPRLGQAADLGAPPQWDSFPPDPAWVAARLTDLKSVTIDGSDAAIIATVAAAETLVDRWRESQLTVEEHWQHYQEAVDREGVARTQLFLALRSLLHLVPNPDHELDLGERRSSPREQTTEQATSAQVRSEAELTAIATPSPVPTVTPDEADIAVFALGDFRILCRGRSIDNWHGAKASKLVRLLATHPIRTLKRDYLIETLWPNVAPENGRRYLHQAVYSLRKTLTQGGGSGTDIVYCNDAYGMNCELQIWLDVAEFERSIGVARDAVEQGRLVDALDAFECAVSLYRSDFLSDDPYEDWARPEAERLRLAFLSAANHAADMRMDRDEADAALALTMRILEVDPCDEAAHRRAIRCHGAAGRRSLITRQYESCSASLRDELGLEPSTETVDLFRSLVDTGSADTASPESRSIVRRV